MARVSRCARMAVVGRQRFAAFEVADQREIDGAPAGVEAAADFDAQQARECGRPARSSARADLAKSISATSAATARYVGSSALNCGLFVRKRKPVAGPLSHIRVLDLSRVLAGPVGRPEPRRSRRRGHQGRAPGQRRRFARLRPAVGEGRATAATPRTRPISLPPTAARSRSRSTSRRPKARRSCASSPRRATC